MIGVVILTSMNMVVTVSRPRAADKEIFYVRVFRVWIHHRRYQIQQPFARRREARGAMLDL